MSKRILRPVGLRRSWLFLPGADRAALEAAAASGADVLIQELEDFTLPEDRPAARRISPDVLAGWKARGIVATVRINPFADGGRDDLEAAMAGAPDAILLPKSNRPGEIADLDLAIGALEARFGIAEGSTEIVPNIELARGLVQTVTICGASARVSAALVASEDMANDLGCERLPDLSELDHVRRRFLIDCRAAGVLPIDMPFTWSSPDGARAHAVSARAMGYAAKSAVNPAHVAILNEELTPSAEADAEAGRVIEAFAAARTEGRSRVMLDGRELEIPHLRRAEAVRVRFREFVEFER